MPSNNRKGENQVKKGRMKNQMEAPSDDFEAAMRDVRAGLVETLRGVDAVLDVVEKAKRLPAPTPPRSWPAIERK